MAQIQIEKSWNWKFWFYRKQQSLIYCHHIEDANPKYSPILHHINKVTHQWILTICSFIWKHIFQEWGDFEYGPGFSNSCKLGFLSENKRVDVVNEVQPRLPWVAINSGNVVHSNVVHTMEISERNQVFRHIPLAWTSGPFLWYYSYTMACNDGIVLAVFVQGMAVGMVT